MSLLLSDFYPKADAVLVTGNQTITGLKTFNERINVTEIRGIGLGGSLRKIDPIYGHLYSNTSISLDYFQRILSGNWKFNFRPTVNGTGVLLQGEASAGGGGTVENAVYTTGSQTITGPKNFTARPTLSGLNLITTGDLVNLELNLEGALASSSAFDGDRPIRRVPVNNTNYGGTTISGFLNNLFFPYTNATVSLSAFSVKNYGYDTIGSETFAGQLNALDDNVTGIACLYGNTILRNPATPVLNNNSYSITNVNFIITPSPIPPSRQSTSDELFKTRIFGTRNGSSFTQDSNLIRLRFEPPYFYGISNNNNLGVQVTGLTRVNASTYLGINGSNYSVGGRPSFINGIQFQFNNIIPNGYIYFAYPDFQNPLELINNWGFLATSAGIVDAVSFADYSSTYTNSTVQINFPTRSNITYRIYRSPLITPVNLPTTFTLNFKFA